MASLRMPAYVLASMNGLGDPPSQHVLRNYSLHRPGASGFEALAYCDGGIVTSSNIIDGYKYIINIGLSVLDRNESGFATDLKIRAICVTAKELDNPSQTICFGWDSAPTADQSWGPIAGYYKSVIHLYRNNPEGLPEDVDNCLRIGAGIYNTLLRHSFAPAMGAPFKVVERALCSVNWAEMIGLWTIDPFSHQSLGDFPRVKSDFPEPPPGVYRAAINARLRIAASAIHDGIELPSYVEACMTKQWTWHELLTIIQVILRRNPDIDPGILQSLELDAFRDVSPEDILAEIDKDDFSRIYFREMVRNQKEIPNDPYGFLNRIFYLCKGGGTDFYYRNRTLLDTEDGLLPWSWPQRIFAGVTAKAYCTETRTGAWTRGKWPRGDLHFDPREINNPNYMVGKVRKSILPHLSAPPRREEVLSLIGFIRVDSWSSLSKLGTIDLIGDGDVLFEGDPGGKLFAPYSWTLVQALESRFGLKPAHPVRENLRNNGYPAEKGMATLIPVCNGSAYYISPPKGWGVLQEYIDGGKRIQHRSARDISPIAITGADGTDVLSIHYV